MEENYESMVTEVQVNGYSLKQIEMLPSLGNMERVTTFVEQTLEELDVPVKAVVSFNIAIDEIFSNIVYYSGATKAFIACGYDGTHAMLQFMDDGKPYNPLEAEDPDTTLAVEDRQIGGLGIFMVRNMMSEMQYRYENRMNCLFMVSK